MTPISSIEIDAVANQLDAVAGAARCRGDRLGMFAALYRQTTRTIGARVAAGHFDDADRMGLLVTAFAARYTGPVEAWLAGGTVPRCWRGAFEAAASGEHVILQHLLMGLNAHINLDLGVAAARVCPGEEIHSLRPCARVRVTRGKVGD